MTDNAVETVPSSFQESRTQHDYFGFRETKRVMMPDGMTWVEISAMNEGQKSAFQKSTSRDMILEKGSGNARFKVDPASERHALLKACIVDWNFMRNGTLQPYGDAALRDFLQLADPKIVELIEREIRKLNPWMMQEMTVEEIDSQIAELEEMRRTAVEREAGEGNSSNK
ncbi:MAG TPA: hypothetical protein VIY48_17990 [Candidatus Paceibacterota bacterium]